jgi:hypothetical protein
MGLLEELKRETAARRADAEADYKRLLDGTGSVDRYRKLLAGDDRDALADLRGAMAALGLAPADVEADAAAVEAHGRATAAVLTAKQRADAEAAVARVHAEVRAEAREALVALFDLVPRHAMAMRAFGELFVAAINSIHDQAERVVAGRLDRRPEWDRRVRVAEADLQQRVQRSAAGAAEAARLVARHPRVLGGLAAVAALPGVLAA